MENTEDIPWWVRKSLDDFYKKEKERLEKSKEESKDGVNRETKRRFRNSVTKI